jgi:hypothetical protein
MMVLQRIGEQENIFLEVEIVSYQTITFAETSAAFFRKAKCCVKAARVAPLATLAALAFFIPVISELDSCSLLRKFMLCIQQAFKKMTYKST